MPEYRYDIFFVEPPDENGEDEKQIYLFNGPHSFHIFKEHGDNRFFDAAVEHLEPVGADPGRIRLKFKISRKT